MKSPARTIFPENPRNTQLANTGVFVLIFIDYAASGTQSQRLLVLLRTNAAVSIGDAHRQLLRTLNDVTALLGGHSVGDLGGVDAVLHHQHLQLLDVVDEELLEARGHHMTGTLGGSITDVGHQVLALEAPADTIVNTLGLAPVLLQ